MRCEPGMRVGIEIDHDGNTVGGLDRGFEGFAVDFVGNNFV
jgi:hypothetical protein